MNLKRFIYSREECNNYVYFAFYAEHFDTEIITKELSIEPSSVRLKAEPIPKYTSWKYRIDAGNELDLEISLESLIEVFETKIEIINQLKSQYKLETIINFAIDIDMNPDVSTPYFGLTKRVVDFLYKTQTTVDYNLYKTDIINLKKKEYTANAAK